MVNEIANTFEAKTYSDILDQLDAAKRQPLALPTNDENEISTHPVKQTVSIKKIRTTGVTGLLEDEADIDRFLDALRNALLSTINDGKRIAL